MRKILMNILILLLIITKNKTMKKPTIKLTGNKKDGFVLSLHNPLDNFKWDQSLTEDELLTIREAINKKLK